MDADGLRRNEQCVSQAQTMRTLCGLFAEMELAGFIDALQAATTAIPILACRIETSREADHIRSTGEYVRNGGSTTQFC